MTSCTVVKNGRMNSGFWLSMFCRMPSATATVTLQLQDHQRDAVDVQHDVRTFGVLARHRYFLGDGEIVVACGLFPVDQPDSLGLLADVRLNLHAVAQQPVDVSVGLVQAAATTDGRSLLELRRSPC